MVSGLTCTSVEPEQTGPTAFRDRLLRDQLRRELVVEVREVHPALTTSVRISGRGRPRSRRAPIQGASRVQKAQRSKTAPIVKPAPTDVSSTRSPFFRRPSVIASSKARGIVAAVVLPNRSMLSTILSTVETQALSRVQDDSTIRLVRHEQIDVPHVHPILGQDPYGRSPPSSARRT